MFQPKVARSFTVQIQNSGPWVDFASTTGNVLTETTSHGATGLAKRLRIVMKDQNSAFGIRSPPPLGATSLKWNAC